MGQVEVGPDALGGCWCPRKPSQAGAPCLRGREGPGKGSGSSPVYTSSPQTSQVPQSGSKITRLLPTLQEGGNCVCQKARPASLCMLSAVFLSHDFHIKLSSHDPVCYISVPFFFFFFFSPRISSLRSPLAGSGPRGSRRRGTRSRGGFAKTSAITSREHGSLRSSAGERQGGREGLRNLLTGFNWGL